MKRIFTVLCVLALALGLAACGAASIEDGTYRAEYDSFDVNGYKYFVEITFADGTVTSVVMDAVCEADGSLKSESEEYKESMQTVVGTYPEKYYTDLINQYIQSGSSEGVEIVAGATSTSNSMVKLLKAIEQALLNGSYEGAVVVPRG